MRTAILIGICLLFSVRAAVAAPPQCPQSWFGGSTVPGTNDFVLQMLEWSPRGDPESSLLVILTALDSSSDGAVYAWDGVRWLNLGGSIDGDANAACVYEGDLVVVGNFKHIGGIEATGIARFDGTRWRALPGTPSVQFLGGPSVAIFQGSLIVSGNFQFAKNVVLERVARYHDGSWQILNESNSGLIHPRFVVTHKGNLYQFSDFGMNNYTYLSRWDGDQWIDRQFIDEYVNDAVSFGDELVVLTNRPASFSGSLSAVAAWNGATWRSLGDSAGIGRGFALCVYQGALHGHFERNERLTISRRDTNTWTDVHSMPRDSALGQFAELCGWRGKLVAVSRRGATLRASVVENGNLEPITFAPYPLKNISFAAPDADRAFVMTADTSPNSFTAQLWDGEQAVVLGSPFNALAKAFARDGNTLYAGGSFSKVGNATVRTVARFDGTEWQPLANAISSGVSSLCMFRGSLYAGGTFRFAFTAPLNRVARWDGTAWNQVGLGVGPTSGGGGNVASMCVYNDNLIVGGIFSIASGVPVSNVARWDGNAWSAMGSLPSTVDYLFVHRGTLIAVRRFKVSDSIARWDGAQWIPIAPAIQNVWNATPHRDTLAIVTEAGLGFLKDPSGSDAELDASRLADLSNDPPQVAISVGNKLQLFKETYFVGGLLVPDHIEWSDLLPPAVLRDPQSSHACAGNDTTLRAGFYSTEPMSFRWEKDGVPLLDNAHFQGTNTPELRLLDVRQSMSGTYQCVASGSCQDARTRPAAFSVCYADFNCDGLVETQDFELFAVAYDQLVVPLAEARFDVNEDGLVDDLDFQLFVIAYNQCDCDMTTPSP